MTGFGEQLKAERERQGLTLDQLCAQTKISLRQLEALERDDLEALPGGVFRRGMVKACLAALALEPEIWLPRFDALCRDRLGEPAVAESAWAEFAENVRRSRTPDPRPTGGRWLGVATLFALLAAAGWAIWRFVLEPRLKP